MTSTHVSKTRQRRLFFLLASAGLAVLFGMWFYFNLHSRGAQPVIQTATIFPQPRLISPFKLIDDQGKPFILAHLKGHFSLIFFGFTHCPDLCPTTLGLLNQAYKIMQSAKLKSLPQIVFISVDPERDDAAALKTYLSSFNPDFLGATGDKAQIDKMTEEMSVLYTKVAQAGDAADYSIDHSGTIILVNPDGHFDGVFTMPHDPQKIANDMKALIGAS